MAASGSNASGRAGDEEEVLSAPTHAQIAAGEAKNFSNGADEESLAAHSVKRQRLSAEETAIVIEDTNDDPDVEIVGYSAGPGDDVQFIRSLPGHEDEDEDDEDSEDEEDSDEEAGEHTPWGLLESGVFRMPIGALHMFSLVPPAVENSIVNEIWRNTSPGAANARAQFIQHLFKGKPRGPSQETVHRSTHEQVLDEQNASRLNENRGYCVICMDNFEKEHVVRRLPCLCVFHKPCVDRHFEDSSKCPVCRSDIRKAFSP